MRSHEDALNYHIIDYWDYGETHWGTRNFYTGEIVYAC